jgi:hypothetical protein
MARFTLPYALLTFVAILLASISPALAGETRYRDWFASVDDNGNGYGAGTTNPAGELFGLICEADGCKWLIARQRECTIDASFPALISNGRHVIPINLICYSPSKTPGFWRYRIEPEAKLLNLLDEPTDQIGVATAHEGGSFVVTRFSLNGAKEALTAMMNMQKNRIPSDATSKLPSRQVL